MHEMYHKTSGLGKGGRLMCTMGLLKGGAQAGNRRALSSVLEPIGASERLNGQHVAVARPRHAPRLIAMDVMWLHSMQDNTKHWHYPGTKLVNDPS